MWEWDLRSDRVAWWTGDVPTVPRIATHRQALEVIHFEDRECVRAAARRVLETGTEFLVEFRVGGEDGRIHWHEARGQLHYTAAGEPHLLLGIWQDITERKRTEEALRRSEEQLRHSQKMEAIGRLAGGVAHDFNNILAVINGYTELLTLRTELTPKVREQLLEIQKAGERAARLTNQLLDFGRKRAVKPQMIDLNELVAGLCTMFHRLVGTDIEIVPLLDPRLARVSADLGQIEQVLINLVVNARDAMPEGGKLLIETRSVVVDEERIRLDALSLPAGSYVLLSVTDTGCGMDEATLSRVFEPFFTTKGAGKGTGLGLATVYGVVEQCGGAIRAHSQEGWGTTFQIYLPCTNEGVSSLAAGAPCKRPTSVTETILLVEDEPGVRGFVREALRQEGYLVLDARSGPEALTICEGYEGPIHLLLTDLKMPQMSGSMLAERVKSLRPEVRLLFISGYTDEATARRQVAKQEVRFLQKPFTISDLLRMVGEVFATP